MDYEDMKHKMIPMHSDFLRRMLAVNEIPEPVMVRYFLKKKYLDKLSAPISVMALLDMAVECGFNLETGLFQKKVKVIDKVLSVEELEAMGDGAGDIIAAPASVNGEDVDLNAETKIEVEDSLDVVIGGSEPIAELATVKVLVNDGLEEGIVLSHDVNEQGEITYRVKIGDTFHEINERDVEKQG